MSARVISIQLPPHSLIVHLQLLGITEVQIIQWYVEEGAHIEEWKPLCQYQSDKAVDDVNFTSFVPMFWVNG